MLGGVETDSCGNVHLEVAGTFNQAGARLATAKGIARSRFITETHSHAADTRFQFRNNPAEAAKGGHVDAIEIVKDRPREQSGIRRLREVKVSLCAETEALRDHEIAANLTEAAAQLRRPVQRTVAEGIVRLVCGTISRGPDTKKNIRILRFGERAAQTKCKGKKRDGTNSF